MGQYCLAGNTTMTVGVIEASWTFVESPTYTTISIAVGLIVGLFLAALVIQQELLQGRGGAVDSSRRFLGKTPAPRVLCEDGRPRRPRGRVAAAPLIICFGVIVILRLTTLAYQRPDTTPTNTTAPTAQQTGVVHGQSTP